MQNRGWTRQLTPTQRNWRSWKHVSSSTKRMLPMRSATLPKEKNLGATRAYSRTTLRPQISKSQGPKEQKTIIRQASLDTQVAWAKENRKKLGLQKRREETGKTVLSAADFFERGRTRLAKTRTSSHTYRLCLTPLPLNYRSTPSKKLPHKISLARSRRYTRASLVRSKDWNRRQNMRSLISCLQPWNNNFSSTRQWLQTCRPVLRSFPRERQQSKPQRKQRPTDKHQCKLRLRCSRNCAVELQPLRRQHQPSTLQINLPAQQPTPHTWAPTTGPEDCRHRRVHQPTNGIAGPFGEHGSG